MKTRKMRPKHLFLRGILVDYFKAARKHRLRSIERLINSSVADGVGCGMFYTEFFYTRGGRNNVDMW